MGKVIQHMQIKASSCPQHLADRKGLYVNDGVRRWGSMTLFVTNAELNMFSHS